MSKNFGHQQRRGVGGTFPGRPQGRKTDSLLTQPAGRLPAQPAPRPPPAPARPPSRRPRGSARRHRRAPSSGCPGTLPALPPQRGDPRGKGRAQAEAGEGRAACCLRAKIPGSAESRLVCTPQRYPRTCQRLSVNFGSVPSGSNRKPAPLGETNYSAHLRAFEKSQEDKTK